MYKCIPVVIRSSFQALSTFMSFFVIDHTSSIISAMDHSYQKFLKSTSCSSSPGIVSNRIVSYCRVVVSMLGCATYNLFYSMQMYVCYNCYFLWSNNPSPSQCTNIIHHHYPFPSLLFAIIKFRFFLSLSFPFI
jgi:hypothetical protein